MGYDVVVVGASVAGCTAAALYGRAGLSVALVEKRADPAAYKVLCGHYVLGGARPVLDRLGVWEPMVAAGAAVGTFANWTSDGWIVAPAGIPPGINLRRERLDPMLRGLAAATPGVDLLRGRAARALRVEGGWATGVVVRDAAGTESTVAGRLVVGADGARSAVARLAAAGEARSPNARFGYWAYYRDAHLPGPGTGQVWRLDPDIAMALPTDRGLTLLMAYPVKERLPEFRADRAGALERFLAGLADAPELSAARRVSPIVGTVDYPCVRRDPTPPCGVALVGDAALTPDPLPAVGCGWALRGAEWLVDATVPALAGGGAVADLRAGLARYREAFRFVEGHDELGRADALGAPLDPGQRALRAAAARDPQVARRLYEFAMRTIPAGDLVTPDLLARIRTVNPPGTGR